MILPDRWHVRNPATGLYLDVYYAPNPPGVLPYGGMANRWLEDPDACTSWGKAGAMTRAERIMLDDEDITLEIVRANGCACCGAVYGASRIRGAYRCEKHRDRNPCAIEGCKRTTASKGYLGSDQWLCAEHWRRFCPARSRKRRLYHAYFRKAKRYGWTEDLRGRFFRFWDRLIADARRKASDGDVDIAEIERMFGL